MKKVKNLAVVIFAVLLGVSVLAHLHGLAVVGSVCAFWAGEMFAHWRHLARIEEVYRAAERIHIANLKFKVRIEELEAKLGDLYHVVDNRGSGTGGSGDFVEHPKGN